MKNVVWRVAGSLAGGEWRWDDGEGGGRRSLSLYLFGEECSTSRWTRRWTKERKDQTWFVTEEARTRSDSVLQSSGSVWVRRSPVVWIPSHFRVPNSSLMFQYSGPSFMKGYM